jgi:acyl carrier protein
MPGLGAWGEMMIGEGAEAVPIPARCSSFDSSRRGTLPTNRVVTVDKAQSLLAAEVAVMATGDSSEVRPELDRRRARSLVFDALTAVIPDLRVEALDERQELYADLGMDSLGFVRLLIELESKLDVPLVDEDLMTIELFNVADLVDLVERISPPAAK